MKVMMYEKCVVLFLRLLPSPLILPSKIEGGLVNGKILLIQKCFRFVGERLIATRKLSTVKTFRAN